MPNINLIAARRAEKKRLIRTTRRLFLGLAVEVGAVVLLVSWIGARQIALNKSLAQANFRMTKLQPTLDRLALVEKEITALKPKLDTLETAKSDTLRWRAMLQIVSQSIPTSAWLSSIGSASVEDEATITLTGVAASQTLVGETMTRLGAFPVFDKIDLRFTQLLDRTGDRATPRVSFEIGARLKPRRPAAAAPLDKKSEPAGEPRREATRTEGNADGNRA